LSFVFAKDLTFVEDSVIKRVGKDIV